MKNILVSIDFNNDEMLLINKAEELARAFGSKLWLMHIVTPNPEFIGYEVGPQYIRDSRADELRKEHRQVQAYANELKEKGLNAEGLLIQGATIEMITKEAQKLNADLIIAGHHQHGFLYNALVGSVSAQIIKNSKIPVLTVPLD